MELYLFTRSAFVARSCQLAVRDKAGLNLHVMQEECVTQVLSVIRRVDALLLDADFLGRAGLESVLSSGGGPRARGIAVFLLAGSGSPEALSKAYAGRAECLDVFSLGRLPAMLGEAAAGCGSGRPRLERLRDPALIPGRGVAADPLARYKRDSFLEEVKLVARTRADVLLVGESGAGKSWLAERIYAWSGRQGNFLSESLANIPPNLFESELFGTVSGAYTDAVSKMGLLEAAGGGTLFLDEIGELPLHLQSKLFSALDKRSFRRVGSLKEQPFSGRIIFATNMDLEEAVRERRFREELWGRISMVTVRVPPLRERPSDIPSLASRFAEDEGKTLSASALEKLSSYKYPGNVRELKHIVCRSCLLCPRDTLGADDIRFSRAL